jgi:hypothetical protein
VLFVPHWHSHVATRHRALLPCLSQPKLLLPTKVSYPVGKVSDRLGGPIESLVRVTALYESGDDALFLPSFFDVT